jgi:hypothetical protein
VSYPVDGINAPTHSFRRLLAAAAGDPDMVAKVRKGHKAGGMTYKVHVDGYNLMPFLKGDEKESSRKEFIYWNDDGRLCGIRLRNIKLNFLLQYHKGVEVWSKGFESVRIPRAFNLRNDPFERAEESGLPFQTVNQLFFIVPAQTVVARWLSTFKEFRRARSRRASTSTKLSRRSWMLPPRDLADS